MAKMLLASQFVAGLRPEIKKDRNRQRPVNRYVYVLVKASFEEAKLAKIKHTDHAPTNKTNLHGGTHHY